MRNGYLSIYPLRVSLHCLPVEEQPGRWQPGWHWRDQHIGPPEITSTPEEPEEASVQTGTPPAKSREEVEAALHNLCYLEVEAALHKALVLLAAYGRTCSRKRRTILDHIGI